MVLTAEKLRSLLHYNQETGEFRWTNCFFKTKNGQVAGCVNGAGYVVIGVGGELYLAHRLAWLYQTGEWPEFEIDHKDLQGSNNAWLNLRAATHEQNLRNLGMRAANTSGRKGVYFSKDKNKWHARIRHGGKQIHLGYFEDLNKAADAYNSASEQFHQEFGRVVNS